jgi:hypothetical protein
MARTIISLPEAIKHYRQESEYVTKPASFKALLKKTAGIWTSGDGLAFQKKLRGEWEEVNPYHTPTKIKL